MVAINERKVNINYDKYALFKINASEYLAPQKMPHLKNTVLLQNISLVLKQLREEKGVTQNVVYQETNIHIGRVETAKIDIRICTLSVLCKYFDISVRDFLERVNKLN